MTETPMLEVRNLSKTFPVKGGASVKAVNGVSFNLAEREVLGIIGESGCGKSTLGRLILRLVEPSAGQVFFRGQDITSLSRRAMRPLRQSMQMVFQNPFASFNPRIRVFASLAEVCRLYGMDTRAARERVDGLFAAMGLSESLFYRWPRELSGGQLQRLAIARALLSNPALIVADEPLSALDVSVQAQLLNLLESIRAARPLSMILISHDMTVVEYLCDRILVMYLGRVMEILPVEALRGDDLHPYTLSLKASSPRLDGRRGESDASAAGEASVPALAGMEAGPNYGSQRPAIGRDATCPFAPRCPVRLPRCLTEIPELKEISCGHSIRCHRF